MAGKRYGAPAISYGLELFPLLHKAYYTQNTVFSSLLHRRCYIFRLDELVFFRRESCMKKG